MQVINADIVVVGAGGAGLAGGDRHRRSRPQPLDRAALEGLPDAQPHLRRGRRRGGRGQENDSLDYHFNDTVAGGDWLTDQDAVELFVNEIPKELVQIEHWGCPWSRESSGHVAVRPFGGMKIMRTWYAADKTGFHMLHTLFQTSLKYPSIKRFDEYYIDRSDGR